MKSIPISVMEIMTKDKETARAFPWIVDQRVCTLYRKEVQYGVLVVVVVEREEERNELTGRRSPF